MGGGVGLVARCPHVIKVSPLRVVQGHQTNPTGPAHPRAKILCGESDASANNGTSKYLIKGRQDLKGWVVE